MLPSLRCPRIEFGSSQAGGGRGTGPGLGFAQGTAQQLEGRRVWGRQCPQHRAGRERAGDGSESQWAVSLPDPDRLPQAPPPLPASSDFMSLGFQALSGF